MFLLGGGEFFGDQVQRCFPGDLDERIALAQERLDQAVGGVDVVPGKLALDAGGDAVRGTVHGLDLEDVPVARPHVEGAADAAVGADGFGFADALVAHLGFHLGEREDRTVAGVGLNALDDLDHVVEHGRGQVGQISGMAEHALFHKRVAGADGDAVAAGDARGAGNLVAAVPENTWVRGGPVDGESLVHLHVLACFHATSAEDALVGVVAVEGVGHVLLVGLLAIRSGLVLHVQLRCGVVHRAVLVVVVAHGAVEHVVLEQAVEGLALRDVGALALGEDDHARGDRGGAGADQMPIRDGHAGVAALDRAHLRQIADLRDLLGFVRGGEPVERLDQKLSRVRRGRIAVDGDLGVRGRVRRCVEERLRGVHISSDAHEDSSCLRACAVRLGAPNVSQGKAFSPFEESASEGWYRF